MVEAWLQGRLAALFPTAEGWLIDSVASQVAVEPDASAAADTIQAR